MQLVTVLQRQLAFVFTVLFIAIPLGTTIAKAQAKSESKQTLNIATRVNLPPYVENGATSGIEIDLVKSIFASTQYEPVFTQQPRIRMIAVFEAGKMDGILTQNINASDVGCATDVYLTHENVAKTLKSRDLTVAGLDGLAGYAVVSFSGATRYIGSPFSDAVKKAARYTETGDQAAHIELLYKNRFDVVVGDRWILRLAQKNFFDKTQEYQELDTHSVMKPSLYVARFHDQAVCSAFNTSLKAMRENGQYAAIWNSYERKLLFTDNINTVPQPHND
jgi:polar amino acid transport system substrate-binding protein